MQASVFVKTALAALITLAASANIAARTMDTAPGSANAQMSMFDSIAACNQVRHSNTPPINCAVTHVQGHPTLAVEFIDQEAMQVHLGEFAKNVAVPFCAAANRDGEQAYFVVALTNPGLGLVSSCRTGESSDWVSVDNASLDR